MTTGTRRAPGPSWFMMVSAIAFALCAPRTGNGGLIICDYVEGIGSNQAIVLYNPTMLNIDLEASGYHVRIFADGSMTPTREIALVGQLPSGRTFLITNGDAAAALTNAASQIALPSLNFDGNDAVALVRDDSVFVDVIGLVGFDPSLGGMSDNRWRRRTTVCTGDSNAFDRFDRSVEWYELGLENFNNLTWYPSECMAASPVPFTAFSGLSDPEAKSVLLKITHYGAQTTTTPSLIVSGQAGETNVVLNDAWFVSLGGGYLPYRAEPKPYVLMVTPATMRSILSSISSLSSVTDGGVDDSVSVLSLSLARPGGGDSAYVFDSILDRESSVALVGAMTTGSWDGSPTAQALQAWICPLGLLDTTQAAADLSDQVSIELGGLRRDPDQGDFVGTVTLTNTSAQPIIGPVSLAMKLSFPMDLASADGRTCLFDPPGMPYVNCPMAGPLSPGTSMIVPVRFRNPDFMRISPAVHLLGPGIR